MEALGYLVPGLVLLMALKATSQDGVIRDYCFPDTFNASCGPNNIILIHSARYGRMKDESECIRQKLITPCFADVLSHVDRVCSGRHDCRITIPDPTLHNLQPCPKDMLGYLEASYSCLPVDHNPNWSCYPQASFTVPGPSGHLASITTVETSLGSPVCPWKISVSPGQRINVTLLDFGVASRRRQTGSICQVYAKIREQGMASDITICGGDTRQRGVYVSESNEIEVMMLTTREDKDPVSFVLNYDVIGCTDPLVPEGAWLKRTKENAAITCNFTTQAWHIICHGNGWFGQVDNCSIVSTKPKAHSDGPNFSKGLMVAVITGLVLGVMIGVALLAMVIVCHRRKHQRSTNPPNDATGRDEAMETVQGTPFLRDAKGNKPPEAVDGGYGYTHVCDVTIYQPYTQQRQGSNYQCDTKPAIEDPAHHQRDHDYEKPGYTKNPAPTALIRDNRFYPDFVEMDQNVNINSPAHKLLYPPDNTLTTPCDH